MGGKPANTPETLWSKVDKKGPNDCWEWKGFRNKQGYGRTWIGDKGYYAHRVIFALANDGIIDRSAPKEKDAFGYLMHTCDNPPCCNPAHLRIGTHRDNMADKVSKGRQVRYPGTTGPRCKLTEDDVRWIRFVHKAGLAKLNAQALLYGVNRSVISHLLYGLSYQDID